jgi:hypothetical protein
MLVPTNITPRRIVTRRNLRCISAAALTTALVLGAAARASAAVIFVTTDRQKVSSTDPAHAGYQPGCSLQEAIFSANRDDNTATARIEVHSTGDPTETLEPVEVRTACVAGSGDDIIVLPARMTFELSRLIDDLDNFIGPAATPIVTSTIRLDAHGATLRRTGDLFFRAFAVGPGGNLTIRNAHITGFTTRGGNGGVGGGGGGMGAGGAVYVMGGALTIDGSTLSDNGAIGGNGGAEGYAGNSELYFVADGGGGGGLGGNGDAAGRGNCALPGGGGGGGGGSRGDGWLGNHCDPGFVFPDNGSGGGRYRRHCGGLSGHHATDGDGGDGACAGGGGGGGFVSALLSGNGGIGHYGGGGGGGAEGGGSGGRGGFGGGGGAGWAGLITRGNGGDGGFGGGGGSGSNGAIDAVSGRGGHFGGNANVSAGGGGAALGGAIFNDSGTVTIVNSTFTRNFALHGLGGDVATGGHAPHGADAGAAVFSRNGRLTVQFSTFAGNVTHSLNSPLSGIVVMRDGGADTFFTLQNSILANNGGERECSVIGSVVEEFAGNLITRNDNCGTLHSIAEDPLLGPLQENQGPTPTMAIASDSPARGAADPAIWVPMDQRGQERSQPGDIGAFELCLIGLPPLDLPCIITDDLGEVTTFTLTMAASPANVGTTSPAPGLHEVAENSVIAVSALPSAGYYLASWSGDVTDPGSASTTVVMTGNRSATANFALIPDFVLSTGPVSALVGTSQTATVTVTANAAFNQSVTLSTGNLPPGITATMNPASVLLAANGSRTSVLTVSVAAFVLPGTYTFTVVGTATNVPGPFPTTIRSVPVALKVIATPAAVSGVVDVLTGWGCIDSNGVANAFKAKLAAAQALIDAGQVQQAVNTLQALLRQLQAQQGKHLATTCVGNGQQVNPAAVLMAQVQAILAGLGGAARANPALGSVVDASGREVAGAVVNILNGSKKPVASAMTDAAGFYYFPATQGLKPGTAYTVSVTLPKGYRSAAPSSVELQWRGLEAILGAFILH